MRITVKFKYGSNQQASKEQCNSDLMILATTPVAAPLTPRLVGPCGVACDDEEPGIISRVNPMNQFFDLPKRLPEPADEPSSPPISGAPEAVETPFSIQQIQTEEVQVLPDSRIVVHSDPLSAGADRFRFLRMCLRELWNAGKLKSLLITSALPQDGKSTIALNLATALAERGKRTVVLIEADLHHPTLTEYLGIEGRMGLADCLESNLNPLSFLRRIEPLGWYLLGAGELRTNPTELLHAEALAGVLQELSAHFDWVLIDAPPVRPLTDALLLARQANATLLVAREGRTPREMLEKAIALLGRQRVLGIVLNGVEGLDRLYTGYYGYGGYSRNNRSKTVPAPSNRTNRQDTGQAYLARLSPKKTHK
jgi:capsular exopolysaccharide synthesis family protein